MKFHLLQVSYLGTNRCTITRCILILEEQPSSSQSNEIKDPTKQTIENSRENLDQNKTEERINELNSHISALVKLRDTGLAVVDKYKLTKLKKRAKGKRTIAPAVCNRTFISLNFKNPEVSFLRKIRKL